MAHKEGTSRQTGTVLEARKVAGHNRSCNSIAKMCRVILWKAIEIGEIWDLCKWISCRDAASLASEPHSLSTPENQNDAPSESKEWMTKTKRLAVTAR